MSDFAKRMWMYHTGGFLQRGRTCRGRRFYLCPGRSILLIVSKRGRNLDGMTTGGRFVGSIDETINADSMGSEDRDRDSDTGPAVWRTLPTLILFNNRCHRTSATIFITRPRSNTSELAASWTGVVRLA